jgi:hypothetical protein
MPERMIGYAGMAAGWEGSRMPACYRGCVSCGLPRRAGWYPVLPKSGKWLRTSGITAGIPVAAPLHHMDERLMHPEDRGTRWRRAMQAD